MEYLEDHLADWLGEELAGYGDEDYLVLDCPGACGCVCVLMRVMWLMPLLVGCAAETPQSNKHIPTNNQNRQIQTTKIKQPNQNQIQ